MAHVDEFGATRHLLTKEQLNDLYRRIYDFAADCTVEEYKEFREAFIQIKTLIHKRTIKQ